MTGPQEDMGPRRYLIAAAVSRYPKCVDWDRPGLVEAREQIIELFSQKLGYRHETALGLDPTRQQLTDHLRAFCTSDERSEDDLVVVYLCGHGEILEDGSEHVLLMADTDPADVTYTSLPTTDLVRVFRGTRVRQLLLILDTCYSGQGGNELASAALERLGRQWAQTTTSTGLLIVSSAQPHQRAKAGMFPRLLSQAVNSRATAGHAPTHLSVSAVVQQMNQHPEKPGYQHISLSLLGLTGEPPDFLTNPRHDVRLTDVDLALQDAAEFDAYALQRETEFTSRLLVRAMGYHGDAAHGWWFCGRHRALADLTAWLNEDRDAGQEELLHSAVGAGECVRVVTAGPGSGKTAVLGLLATLTMPERRRTVPVDALGLQPDWIPDEGSIDVVMYAQNLTDNQILSGLAAAAGFRCATVGELLDALEQRNDGRNRPFTVLIDALDEAATPDTLCSQLLRPLIEHSDGCIRLLLGTRPYLLDRLGLLNRPAQRDGMVIDLDSPRYADRDALLSYTMRNLLQSRSSSPYRSTQPSLLRAVAQAVADAAGRSFLVARFAAYTLASADTTVADPYSPRWQAGLPRHAGQAMRNDLTSRLGPDAERAADLLRPLAYAEGQGLPWEDIWAPLASAISGRTYTDEDLLWLRHHAGSYVVEATESGRSAYRLYHQALTEHLRENTDPIAVHAAFVDTLSDCVPYRSDATRDWSRAHPYTLNHLATHAAAAGRIDDLLDHTEYLVYARPHSLTPHLHQASSNQARLTAAVYRSSFGLHATATPSVRRNLLALNAARADAAALLEQLNSSAHADEWLPAWATGHDFTPALRHTLTGHRDPIRRVACTVLEGRPVAVVGTFNEVYVWDLATGQPIGEPLIKVTEDVLALACTVLDGRPVIVIATWPDTVSVRDLTTGQPICKPFTGLYGVHALACTVLDGRPVTVSAADTETGGRVYVRDLETGQPIGKPLTGLDGVHALACTVLDGRPVTVIGIGTGEGHVQVRDLETGRLIGKPLTKLDIDVGALTCAVLDGRPVIVIATGTGLFGGRVYVRDLRTGEHIGEHLTGLNGRVYALGSTALDDRPVIVTVAANSTVRSWDFSESFLDIFLASGPDDDWVYALAFTVLGDRPVAVIATGSGLDSCVYVSDVATGQPIGEPLGRLAGKVRALACTVLDGRPVTVIATGSGLGEVQVQVQDLVTGQPIGEPITGLDGWVDALACTVLYDRPVTVAHITNSYVGTATYGRWVYLWDLATGQPIGAPLTEPGSQVQALACTVLDGRPVTVIATESGLVQVWDLTAGQPIGEPLSRRVGKVQALACTVLDGRPVTVIATESGLVQVWDLATGQSIGEPLSRRVGKVQALACTVLDGQPITAIATLNSDLDVITTGNSDLDVWDMRTGKLLQHLVIEGLRDVQFSPDGSLVVVMGRDTAVLRRQPGSLVV
ncbi:caspase family protein [Streptomyces sp. NPDC006235]|uniref:caspase family protein n=1 Tax=Streptomyces sp. NPDC006235 TaxID=3156736 RepID=UPI0033AF3643